MWRIRIYWWTVNSWEWGPNINQVLGFAIIKNDTVETVPVWEIGVPNRKQIKNEN